MTILQKIFIILIILFMMFGAFAFLGRTDSTLAAQEQPGANRNSTSVAWLEMCASFLSNTMIDFLLA
ncbi:MAG: hypothetical protein IMY85_01400 [Chloroflexi bacterium]|nr:hypothetical protein [Chloroflexota bacterium]